MRTTYTIEDFLGSRSKIAVLRVLCGVGVPLNPSQIAARTGLTHPAVTAVLRAFEESGIAESSSAGRATIFRIQRDNVYVTNMLLPLLDAERQIPEVLVDELSARFREITVSVILFGSYARGDQDHKSDVDVLFVAADPEGRKRLEDAISAYGLDFRRRFGATLGALVYDLPTAAKLLESRSSLAGSILWEGVTISGLGPAEWSTHAP